MKIRDITQCVSVLYVFYLLGDGSDR